MSLEARLRALTRELEAADDMEVVIIYEPASAEALAAYYKRRREVARAGRLLRVVVVKLPGDDYQDPQALTHISDGELAQMLAEDRNHTELEA